MFNENDNVAVPKFDPTDSKKPTFVKKEGPLTNISQRRFYRFLLAIRNNDKNAFHWLWFARRLAEFFVISVLNRIERNEMDFLKEQQEKMNLREVIAKDYIDALSKGLQKEGKKLGRVFMMPSYFAGSRQYYQKAYADLMTIVRRMGNPTW